MKRIIYLPALIAALILTLSLQMVLQTAWSDEAVPDAVHEVAKRMLNVKPDSIRESDIQGIYEIRVKTNLFYTDAKGRFLIAGNSLIDTQKMINVTEESQRLYRKENLAGISDKETVIFKPKDPKYKIYVFTDVECGYCRKFHASINKLMDMKVEVRYLFAPFRGALAYDKAVGVWCSSDKQKAMTRAKAGQEIPLLKCPNPIEKHLEWVKTFGVSGTPMMVLEHGTVVNGYVEPKELLKRIEKDFAFKES